MADGISGEYLLMECSTVVMVVGRGRKDPPTPLSGGVDGWEHLLASSNRGAKK